MMVVEAEVRWVAVPLEEVDVVTLLVLILPRRW
jgi:hypothetical protein